MTFEGWIIFALFWVVFVTTPGPNAVNCIQNGMTIGFRRAMIGVLAILTQATGFLILSAFGVTGLIAASPQAFIIAKYIGAAFLIYLGIRGWMNAHKPLRIDGLSDQSVYFRALAIATINPKSVAGYLAAFSQFVQLDQPIWDQMWLIMPTALTITALSYTGFTIMGVMLGRMALGAVANVWFRRVMSICFIIYGLLLGASSAPTRTV
ncbi:MAG: LysE family translocator [Paracoccaceae bacterium]